MQVVIEESSLEHSRLAGFIGYVPGDRRMHLLCQNAISSGDRNATGVVGTPLAGQRDVPRMGIILALSSSRGCPDCEGR